MNGTVIFVDIDGPLLPSKLHLLKINRRTGRDNPPEFDRFAVRAFNLWAKYSNAKIVFSTNWCCGYTSDELEYIMRVNGLAFDYHEDILTPKKFTSSRHTEILDWLRNHPECKNFIAVDDDQTCRYIEDFLQRAAGETIEARGKWINVDFEDGLTLANFKDGCEQLGIDQDQLAFEEFGVKMRTAEEKEATIQLLRSFT